MTRRRIRSGRGARSYESRSFASLRMTGEGEGMTKGKRYLDEFAATPPINKQDAAGAGAERLRGIRRATEAASGRLARRCAQRAQIPRKRGATARRGCPRERRESLAACSRGGPS